MKPLPNPLPNLVLPRNLIVEQPARGQPRKAAYVGRFSFDGVLDFNRTVRYGALLTAPPKRAMKAGKISAKAIRDGEKSVIASDRAFKSAGLRKDYWQWRD